ncbi:DUF6220 domain-containing protein [Leptolyngbya sp. FACHB-261]|uniref:DUF6220 domain-containing protein n=1 Tax=Leptolyngbya sp. FACHB-261 TaxID=2692806 RepID=UPI0016824720|nr:DUF6220 domain-containing protein [Leptolyngbya sp. FACHB-261]MBD2101933.1 hypothetical protein [Leptolyngbya sp. FACHB-261]
MTTNLSSDGVRLPGRWSKIVFLSTSALYTFCLVAQLLTVGLAVFYGPEWWNVHVWLVRGFGGLAAVLLGLAFLGPFPQRIRILTGSLTVLLGLQFLTIHLHPALSVLHPLSGFLLFTVATTLVHRASNLVFPKSDVVVIGASQPSPQA